MGKWNKILMSLAAAMAVCAGAVLGQDSDWDSESDDLIRITKKVTGGSCVITNDYAIEWRLASVEYFPDATVTNVATISRVRTLKSNQYQGNLVTTNFEGTLIETNYIWNVTNTVSVLLTNQLDSATTTNDTHVTLVEIEDFPANVFFNHGDKINLSFTDTNLYVIITGLR